MGELSENETKLFKALNGDWLIFLIEQDQIVAPKGYEMLARTCFVENKKGLAVNKLRAALLHFDNGGYRKQPEFDKLICLPEKKRTKKQADKPVERDAYLDGIMQRVETNEPR